MQFKSKFENEKSKKFVPRKRMGTRECTDVLKDMGPVNWRATNLFAGCLLLAVISTLSNYQPCHPQFSKKLG